VGRRDDVFERIGLPPAGGQVHGVDHC
jgi:hypothetical protein